MQDLPIMHMLQPETNLHKPVDHLVLRKQTATSFLDPSSQVT